jgi:hypothetical protein
MDLARVRRQRPHPQRERRRVERPRVEVADERHRLLSGQEVAAPDVARGNTSANVASATRRSASDSWYTGSHWQKIPPGARASRAACRCSRV